MRRFRPYSLLLPCTVLITTLAACSGERTAMPPAEAPLVTVVVPGLKNVIDTVTFTGSINARDEIPITLEGDSSRIAAILVEVGDHVRKGQVLARLNPSVIAPQVTSLEASLIAARAAAEQAVGDYRRGEGVAASGALSKEEIARRRSVAESAQANVKVAAAQLAEMRARLGRTEIRAPADGIVLTRAAEVGQTAVQGGDPLFRLGRGGEVEMRGLVAEQDLPKLAVGQPALVRVIGNDQPFKGTVRLLGAVIDATTRMGSIKIALPSDPDLRPGAFARGEVTVGEARHPVLPQTAVLTDMQGNYVLIVDAQGIAQRRDVKIVGTGNAGVTIGSGLSGDERVVATAAAFLRVGEKVRVTGAAA